MWSIQNGFPEANCCTIENIGQNSVTEIIISKINCKYFLLISLLGLVTRNHLLLIPRPSTQSCYTGIPTMRFKPVSLYISNKCGTDAVRKSTSTKVLVQFLQ